MIIMKIFSPSLPASAQKTQASPTRSKHTRTALKNGRDTETRRHVSFEQVCQPDSQVHQQSHLDSTLPPVSLAVQPGPDQDGRPRKSVPGCVSALGLGKSFHAAAWDASLPGSSYPGRTTESELVPKSVWQSTLIFNNTSLHAHVLLVPCPGSFCLLSAQPPCRCHLPLPLWLLLLEEPAT